MPRKRNARSPLVLEAPCVIPGLINAHAHLELSGEADTMTVFVLTNPVQRALISAGNARKTLESGVTTVRDLGGTEKTAIQLNDAIAAEKRSDRRSSRPGTRSR